MWKPASFALASAACLALSTPIFAHHDGDHAIAPAPRPVMHAGKTGGMDHGELAKAKIGEIMISMPMIRATPPAAPAAGGFVTLHNMGATDDTLIAARISPDVAAKVELHTMEMDGDVMRMFEVEGGIPVPAGETVMLAPGGLHIMLMGLPQGLNEGVSYDVTLVFATAGEVTLPFAVLPLAKVRELMGGGHGHGGHGQGGHVSH
jgi:hypothetical protein